MRSTRYPGKLPPYPQDLFCLLDDILFRFLPSAISLNSSPKRPYVRHKTQVLGVRFDAIIGYFLVLIDE